MLDTRHNWDLSGVQTLQMDQESLPWRELNEIILAVPGDREEVCQALSMLKDWDGVVSGDSPAASVFEFFLSEMDRRIVEAKAPHSAEWVLGKGFAPLFPYSMLSMRRVGQVVRHLRDQPEGWFDRSWQEEMADAVWAVIRTLRERNGTNPNKWAWGQVRPLILRHSMGERAPLDSVFNLGPLACRGDANTVGQAAVDPADPFANPLAIAALRMAIEVGNWDESRFVLPAGQSGNPLSLHYDDLLPLWERGEGVPIAWSLANVKQVTRSLLHLIPV